MTTYEQLIRAYVATGREHWETLDQDQKYALTDAYFTENWQDLGDAMFPSRASSISMLQNITRDKDGAHTGLVAAARLTRYVGESRLVREAFEDAREIQAQIESEPDPDEELPAFLRPQAC